jgi:hypothetical protein
MNHIAAWDRQFPDFDELPPLVAELRHKGELLDISYRNDACPSFIRPQDRETLDAEGSAENIDVLWVNYADPAKREFPETKRFLVSRISAFTAFETDDEAEAIARLLHRQPPAEKTWADYAKKVQSLANDFDIRIKTALGDVDYTLAIEENATETNPGICHTHDHCDANVVMAEAFKHVAGYEIDLQSSYDAQLWNDAWNQWKSDRKKGGAS